MAVGRTLCLDVGERRVGVAVSDLEGRLASPLMVITRREPGRDFRRIAELAREHEAQRVVVGLPRTLAGEIGPQARRVQRWSQRLACYLDVPIVFADERYSTAEAARRLSAAREDLRAMTRPPSRGHGMRRRRGTTLDAAAAAVILQDFLDTTP